MAAKMLKRQVPVPGGILVTITDRKHPHYGEHGTLTGDLITFRFSGETMALVKLDHCAHGGDACYVSKGQVQERK
jgi:hypothetical protein